jgi:hypothetical protein
MASAEDLEYLDGPEEIAAFFRKLKKLPRGTELHVSKIANVITMRAGPHSGEFTEQMLLLANESFPNEVIMFKKGDV